MGKQKRIRGKKVTKGSAKGPAPKKMSPEARREQSFRDSAAIRGVPVEELKAAARVREIMDQGLTPESGGIVELGLWEDVVFLNGTMFTAVVRSGVGEFERHEFSEPGPAMDKALTMKGPGGREALVYAVTELGRRVCLARKDWPRLRLMWAAKMERTNDRQG